MKLRIWNQINIGSGRIFHYDVDSVKEAKEIINTLADIQLKSPEIESNAFGLEEFIDGHWCEWYDEEGYSIDELGTLEDFVVGNYVVDDYYCMTKIDELDDTNAYGKVGYDIYRKEIMGIPFNSPIKLLRRATEKEISDYNSFVGDK